MVLLWGKGREEERKEGAVFLPPGGIKSLGAADWRKAPLGQQRPQIILGIKYLGETF